ncbi:CRISPR system Cascade subunit CasB [Raineyella antarctica]|uniref:CRISPR system Cascade subunit CasB n=1 Tax=Raineyella antarctica TaxID=1577474 RepID=A0A1G6H5Y7_9ACTN|nr:type I-E CRISPR-associated protein Cse2/CasB [Raineyella antarctica]SDB89690.1 CRISPR system Cascade subunit CasB [Raineyella antarctica]
MTEQQSTPRASGHVGNYVKGIIYRLVPSGGGQLNPRSRAQLAQLRRGVGKEPGSVPEIWDLTLDGLDGAGQGQAATPEENAVHIALTMFSVHQQAKPMLMHTSTPFGQAVRRLASTLESSSEDVHEGPVYRRFTQLATAASLDELTHHARALVTQMRSADVGFDYGRFADDLVAFQDPRRVSEVQRRWARDFHHLRSNGSAPSTDQPETTSSSVPPEGVSA